MYHYSVEISTGCFWKEATSSGRNLQRVVCGKSAARGAFWMLELEKFEASLGEGEAERSPRL